METIKKAVIENKHSKYVIAAVVILLAIYGGFAWGNKSARAPEQAEMVSQEGEPMATTTATTTPAAPKSSSTSAPKPAAVTILKDGSYLVSYTASGFSPRTLTIKKGKSVHFSNASNKAMSITAVESANQIYRELNQSKTVGRGGSFDFTFLTAGTWEYMNRNNPSDRGVVIVQ